MGRFRMRVALALSFVAALLMVGSRFANAQQVFGSIIGTVTDPSGSAVSNAKVTVTEVNKQTSSDVQTNESGNYTRGQLIPGTYKVTIESPGFQKVVSSEITVSVDLAARFDAALKVGDVTQQVEVSAAAPLLQTDRADVAQTFSGEQLTALPNITRNVQQFQLLNPGTVRTNFQHASSENPQGSVQLLSNGQYFSATGFQLDGTINQDPILGIIVINPTEDSVSEVKQANQDYDAEFGAQGAGLQIYSTKSGSNEFHGDAFDYLQINTPGFQSYARNPFNAAENTGVPTRQYNQFGGSIAGRVIKDKLFFFADAQLLRDHQGGSFLTTVPTAAERLGDLSDWLTAGSQFQIYNPASTLNPTVTARTPYVNNVIPQSQLNQQALNIAALFPLPNLPGFRNNYSTSGTDVIEQNLWNTRWDYVANEKNSFFGRYSYAGFNQNAPGAFGNVNGGPSSPSFQFAGTSDVLNQSIAGGWTYTVNPSTINEVRFGYMRYKVAVLQGGVGTSPAAQAGIPGLNLDDFYSSGLPSFNITESGDGDQGVNGRTQIGYALNQNRSNSPLNQFERQYQFVDNLSHTQGNHNLKFGADVRYALNLRVPSDSHRAGELTFNPAGTGLVTPDGTVSGGLGLATFLLGDVSSFARYVSSSTDAQERQKRLFFYGQDQWRVSSKFTFNYGVRWEMVFPENINHPGNGAALNLNTGAINVFGVGLNSDSGYQQMNWHNFAPRVGLAYQLTPKTVVRAGYGWSYSPGTFGSTFGHNVTQNPPILANQSLNAGSSFNSVFNLANGPAAPVIPTPDANGNFQLPVGIAGKARPVVFTMPVVYAYNAGIERQVGSKISVSASYVGNSGRHGALGTAQSFNVNEAAYAPGITDANLLKPYYGKYGWTQNIDYYCNCANNQYSSLQVIGNVRAFAGYTATTNFTYQVSKGDGFGSDAAYSFLYNRALGYGYQDGIPRRQFTLAQTYDIPFGHGRRYGAKVNRFIDFALGGWTLSGVTQYFSGVPFNPTTNRQTALTGPNDRPDKGSGSPYSGAAGDRSSWFNNADGAFVTAAGPFGNYPINELYGPHFISQDATVRKTFNLTERFKFTLRTDATNLFNHTNLDVPNSKNILDSNVGQITQTAFGGTYQLRRLQFSGRIDF